MRSTQPLSQKSLALLQSLQKMERANVMQYFLIAFVSMLAAWGFFYLGDSAPPKLRGTAIPALLLGLYSVYKGMEGWFGYRHSRNNPSHNNLEYIIQDVLIRTEVIDNKIVRYHFNNQHADLYVAAGRSYNMKYMGELHSEETITNAPVTLTYMTYSPGIDILVGLTYQQHSRSNTSIIPLEEKDRKSLLYWSGVAIAIIWSFLFFVAFIGIAASRFNLHTTLTMLAFVFPIALISYVIWYLLRRPVKQAKNKIVLTSAITEKITIREKTRYSYKLLTHYRLEDGDLYYIKDGKFKLGDTLVLQFIQDTNGNKSTLIKATGK